MKRAILNWFGVIFMVIATGCSPEAAGAAKAKPVNAETLAISMIAKYEGFRDKVYVCAGGVKTIGYGFTDKALVAKGSITRKEADRQLGIIVRKELKFVNETCPGLNASQQAACVSFIFNLGRGNFLSSTMLKKLKAKDYCGAAAECNKWVYCKGKVLNGLVKRRAAESALMKA